jgi:CheY-like chemotaxis protein
MVPALAKAIVTVFDAGGLDRRAVVRSSPGRAMSSERRVSTILIVDDNDDLGEALSMWLGDLGHEVRLAKSAEAAIAIARDARPDAMLCDIGLPDMTGYDLARAIRADAALADVRLIALTGFTSPRASEQADEAGFDAYLSKPVDPDLLERALAPSAR